MTTSQSLDNLEARVDHLRARIDPAGMIRDMHRDLQRMRGERPFTNEEYESYRAGMRQKESIPNDELRTLSRRRMKRF